MSKKNRNLDNSLVFMLYTASQFLRNLGCIYPITTVRTIINHNPTKVYDRQNSHTRLELKRTTQRQSVQSVLTGTVHRKNKKRYQLNKSQGRGKNMVKNMSRMPEFKLLLKR